jgi:hypothetical protein
MVSVVQLVEHQVVVLEVAGSSPVTHPTGQGRLWSSRGTFPPMALQPCRNAGHAVEHILGKCLGFGDSGYPNGCGPACQGRPSRDLVFSMNELEQLARDVRGFATEVRRLGYSSVAEGHENRFLELSERMMRQADRADEHRR